MGVGEGGKVIGNGRKGYLHKLHMPHSGVSRISARWVLKVRSDTKSGGGGGQFTSGPI